MQNCQKTASGIRSRSCFFSKKKSIRETPRRLLPDDEPREPRELFLRIDVHPVHTDLPPPINTEPARPRRVYIRNSAGKIWDTLLDASAAKQRWPRGLRVITRDSGGHESSKPCLQMPTSVHESGKRTKEWQSLSVSDAEPSMKKVRFTEHTTVLVLFVISTSHTVSAPVAHGGSPSSSASVQKTATVEHVRPDGSDEHIASKKLKFSEPGSLPSNAPMSADVNLSSDDMRAECLLDRFERERVACKSNDPLLSRIAGWVPDEQFLEVAGLDGPARCRVACDLSKLEQSQNGVHTAETFSQPKTAVTPSRVGLTPGLLCDMSRSCWDLDVQANAERFCDYL